MDTDQSPCSPVACHSSWPRSRCPPNPFAQELRDRSSATILSSPQTQVFGAVIPRCHVAHWVRVPNLAKNEHYELWG